MTPRGWSSSFKASSLQVSFAVGREPWNDVSQNMRGDGLFREEGVPLICFRLPPDRWASQAAGECVYPWLFHGLDLFGTSLCIVYNTSAHVADILR